MKIKKSLLLAALCLGAGWATPTFASENTTKLAADQKELETAKTQVSTSQAEKKQLTDTIATLTAEKQQLATATDSAADELAKIEEKLAATKAQLAAIKGDFLRYSLALLQNQTATLEADIDQQQDQQADARFELALQRGRLTNKETALAAAQAQQAAAAANEKKAAETVAQKEAAISQLQAAIQAEEAAAVAAAATSSGIDHSGSANTYAYGQCTWYVKNVAPWVGSNWGNASNWGAAAAAEGFLVDGSPAAGAVGVFAPGQVVGNVYADATYGHVVYVESYDAAAGTITISQGNGASTYATIPAYGLTFIHR